MISAETHEALDSPAILWEPLKVEVGLYNSASIQDSQEYDTNDDRANNGTGVELCHGDRKSMCVNPLTPLSIAVTAARSSNTALSESGVHITPA